MDEHSIEQTVYTLRRKLGESATTARLLVSRRCLGYALLIDEHDVIARHLTPAYM